MTRLTAAELLSVWERSYSQSPCQRALTFVVSAYSQYSHADVAIWPIGFRDRHVASIRAAHFGNRVLSAAACPTCNAPVEFQVELDQCFRWSEPLRSDTVSVTLSGSTMQLRPLSTRDVLSQMTAQAAPEELVRRCLTSAETSVIELSTSDVDALAMRLEELDPESRIEFSLCCPECQAAWSSPFDIVSVFWTELNTWARRVMQEIHVLASRYGWSEAEILAMSPWRRAIYLGLTGAR